MKKIKRTSLIILCLLLSVMLLSTGCVVQESGTKETTASEAKTTTSEPKVEPPVKLKMFFGDAGIAFPNDIDKSDNPFLNIIEKAANVDLGNDTTSLW